MQVDLAGRVAAIAGADAWIGAPLRQALIASGALVGELGDSPADALTALLARHSRLDILINLAITPQGTTETLEALCRHAAAAMTEGGRIVAVTSAFGQIPARGESRVAVASAAILSLTRTLALELGPWGVLVNAVTVAAHGGDYAGAKRLLSHVPLARAARPEELVAAILFLVDPDNSYTTGHIMTVDGGWTAGYARNF